MIGPGVMDNSFHSSDPIPALASWSNNFDTEVREMSYCWVRSYDERANGAVARFSYDSRFCTYQTIREGTSYLTSALGAVGRANKFDPAFCQSRKLFRSVIHADFLEICGRWIGGLILRKGRDGQDNAKAQLEDQYALCFRMICIFSSHMFLSMVSTAG